MKYYFIIDDPYAGMPYPWNKVPEEIQDSLSPDKIYNVLAVGKGGMLQEKTIIYVAEMEEFEGDDNWFIVSQVAEDMALVLDKYDIS